MDTQYKNISDFCLNKKLLSSTLNTEIFITKFKGRLYVFREIVGTTLNIGFERCKIDYGSVKSSMHERVNNDQLGPQ